VRSGVVHGIYCEKGKELIIGKDLPTGTPPGPYYCGGKKS